MSISTAVRVQASISKGRTCPFRPWITSSPAAAVISVVITGVPASIASLITTPQQSPEVGNISSFDCA